LGQEHGEVCGQSRILGHAHRKGKHQPRAQTCHDPSPTALCNACCARGFRARWQCRSPAR
jgi:hypothetical protein